MRNVARKNTLKYEPFYSWRTAENGFKPESILISMILLPINIVERSYKSEIKDVYVQYHQNSHKVVETKG